MKSKWFKTLIVVVTVIPWSVVLVLLLQIKSIVFKQPKVETVPVIEVVNTTINEQPKFFSYIPKEGLKEALSYYGLKHKDIVYAQAILETERYCKFKHWAESVVAYRKWIQKKYQPP